MKIYFGICVAMWVLVMVKLNIEKKRFQRKYPNAKFEKPNGLVKCVVSSLKLFLCFCIPVVNVIATLGMLSGSVSDKLESALKEECKEL